MKKQGTRPHRKAICIICHGIDQPTALVPVTDWTGATALAHPHHPGVDGVRADKTRVA